MTPPGDPLERLVVPDTVWRRDDVCAALAGRDVRALFQLLRQYCGASQTRIGMACGGMPQSHVSAIMRGQRLVTDLATFERIADGLGLPDFARQLLGLAPQQTGTHTSTPSGETPPPSHAAEQHAERDRIVAAADAWNDAEVIEAAASQSAAFSGYAEATNVGGTTLEQLYADLSHTACAYLVSSPWPLYLRSLGVRNRAFALLKGHQYPGQSRDLYVVAGQACNLLAWMSGDLGQLATAETHGRTAWVCARVADHTPLEKWVLSTQAKTAFWAGRYREAIDLTQRGLVYRRAGSVDVLLSSQQADACAALDDARDAMIALARASGERAQANSPDDFGGLFSCGPARQANYAAGVHLRCGNYRQAIAAADEALAGFRGGDLRAYGTEGQTHISRALGYLADGQIDGVAHALSPVFAMPPEQRLDTLTRRLAQVSRGLADPRLRGSAEADTVREQVEGVCAHSARQLTSQRRAVGN